ncbi:hypothetical protein [Streptomyces sp. NPDC048188]|uniref:hypothetical protein n=1 Tax=Streptomyces sp. NPDC048188 TaxID=3155749 RepID=UPI0034470B5A
MSSTYRILCLSHDPALVEGEYASSTEAEAAVATGVEGHRRCDLLIGRYSYPLVEVGCPASKYQAADLLCCHGEAMWVDAEWLLLLAAAHQSSDEGVTAAVGRFGRHCWQWERLRRLRDELGFTVRG